MHQEDDFSQRVAAACLTEEEQEQLRMVMERAQVSFHLMHALLVPVAFYLNMSFTSQEFDKKNQFK